jgi:hypothetical protein
MLLSALMRSRICLLSSGRTVAPIQNQVAARFVPLGIKIDKAAFFEIVIQLCS